MNENGNNIKVDELESSRLMAFCQRLSYCI